ncbi:MAG: ArsR/SmtB family transcription factor [Chloroflexota bacterium]
MLVAGRAARPEGSDEVDSAPSCGVKGADLVRVRRGRAGLLPEQSYVRLADTFRSLADPSRARILHSLLQQELCTCDLAAITCLSEPAVSQHLRLLRALRLVRTRREGKKVYYALADAHVRFILAVSLSHLAHGSPTAPQVTDQPA